MIKSFFRTLLGQLVLAVLFSWSTLAQTAATGNTWEWSYLEPASYLIEDIHVTGTKTLESEALLAIAGLKVGDTVQIPGSAINDAIKRLWKQKLIKDVVIHASKVVDKRIVLTIDITESPRLSAYFFEGIEKSEEKELTEKISLPKGKIVTDRLIKNTQKTLQEHLVSQGYLDAVVSITSLPDPALPDYTQLKISIDKGEKLIINKILIKGNHSISDKVLKVQLQHIKEKPRFTLIKDILKKTLTLQPFRKGGILWRMPTLEETMVYLKHHVIPFSSKFIQPKYEEDKKRLIYYYQTQGYRDATIVEDTVYKQAEGLLNVQLQIEEGKQYWVRDIQWVGNYIYDDDTLNHILGIRPGDIYNPALIQERLFFNPEGKDVASLYMDNGYLFFNAKPVEVRIEKHAVDLEIRIQEEAQAYINKVTIRGNPYTHDYVIRRELKTLPGDKYNRAKVIRSQRELAMLNIFDPAKTSIVPIPNPTDSTVDLIYEVRENPKFKASLSISGGGGKQAPTFAFILGTNNFSLRNALQGKVPLGDAQTADLKAEFYGSNHQNFALQFIEPWLGGKKPNAFSVALNRSYQQLEKKSALGSIGLRISLGTKLKWPDDYFSISNGIDYHRHKYDNYDLLDNKCKLSGVMHDLSISSVIKRNSVDSPIYPKEGSEIGLHARLTPPYSWFSDKDYGKLGPQKRFKWKEYHQWILDGSYFYKLIGDLVLNMRGHFGLLGGYSSQQGIGPFERFTMGGTGLIDYSLLSRELISLRGYPDEYINPKDPKKGYKGGAIFDKFVLELRYPLVKSSLAYIYALSFAEAGNTWLHYNDWKPLDLKRSVGLGIRAYLPLLSGALGIDWGYGFDKEPDKGDKLVIHWSFGGNLR